MISVLKALETFIVFLVNLLILESWMSGFYERKVSKKANIFFCIIFACIGVAYHRFFYIRALMGTIRFLIGTMVQLIFVDIVYGCRKFRRIVSFIVYVALANMADVSLYIISKLVLGDNFINIYLQYKYLWVFELLHTVINILYIQIIFAIKNRLDKNSDNLQLVFLCSFNIVILVCIQYIQGAGESSKVTGDFVLFASVILALVVLFSLGVYLVFKQQRKNRDAAFIAMQLEMQRNQMDRLKSQYSDLRKIRHDYKNHISVLNVLFKSKKYDEAENYIDKFSDELASLEGISFCGNAAVDAVLYTKKIYAAEKGIDVNYDIQSKIPENIAEIDICTLLFNLLDNAIEYSIINNKDNVNLNIHEANGYFVIASENECDDFNISTTKADKKNHGIGLSITKSIARKYDGNEFVGMKGGKFIHIVSLKYN